MKKIVVAVDGFSSCGKSTMAKDLANKIGYIYIDSGAMYRAITLFSIQNDCFQGDELDQQKLQQALDSLKIEFKYDATTQKPVTYLNGVNVENEIRSMEVSNKVSVVSAVGFVRHAMVKQQQEIGKQKGIVMDGRDIGTVVFPEAELKIFVTASSRIRAQRRLDELRSKGDTETTLESVQKNIEDRDYLDQNRLESPLRKADDAIELDNSELTVDEQMNWLLDKFNVVIENE